MEQNTFDQFDAPASTAAAANPFDQFDEVKESSVTRRALGDTGVSLLRGAIAVPEAAVGIADIATGGRAGKVAEGLGFRPKEAKEILNEYYSPEQKAANQKLSEAEGFVDNVKTAVQNPSTILQAGVESVPLIAGGGVVGLGARALKATPVIAGAIGEGAVGAGMAAEGIRQETDDGLLSAKQSGIAALSGLGTAAFGAAGGKLAQKLGIGDIDTIASGGVSPATNKGFARKLVEGGIAEGVFEELPQSVQEQMLSNYALDKPLTEGVDKAAAMGLLTGSAMGAGVGALTGGKDKLVIDQSGLEADAALAEQKQAEFDAQQSAQPEPDEFTNFTQQVDADIEQRKIAAGIKKPTEAIPASDILGDENVSTNLSGLDNSSFSENLPDAASTNTNSSFNIPDANATLKEGESSVKIPSKRMVLDSVLSSSEDSEVFNSIVSAIPIDVMNLLKSMKISPQVFLNDESMLSDFLFSSRIGSSNVPATATASFVDSLAGLATEKTNSIGSGNEASTTLNTGFSTLNDESFGSVGVSAGSTATSGSNPSIMRRGSEKQDSAINTGIIGLRDDVTPNSNVVLGEVDVEASTSPPIISEAQEASTTKQPKAKRTKPAKPKTLLATLRDLGGIALTEKQDVTGEVKGFAPGGYNQVFKQASNRSLKGLIESGDLDDYLPYNMRLESNSMNDDAFDSTEAYDYLSDKIRNGESVLPYAVVEEAQANQYYQDAGATAESDVQEAAELLTEDEINEQLRQATNEERETATEARVINTERENSDTGSSERSAATTQTNASQQAEVTGIYLGIERTFSDAQDRLTKEPAGSWVYVIQGDGSFDSTPQYNVAFSIGGGRYTSGDTASNKQDAFNNAQKTAGRYEGLKLSPEKTELQTDLLGDNTTTKQAVADAERAKDAKRNSGNDNQDTFTLTGSNSEADQAAAAGAQDLFRDDAKMVETKPKPQDESSKNSNVESQISKLEKEIESERAKIDAMREKHMQKYRDGSATRAQTTTHNANVDKINDRVQSLRAELKELKAQATKEVSTGADVAENTANQSSNGQANDEVAKATEALTAAGVKGKEKLDTIKDVREGKVTADEVADAYGAQNQATEEDGEDQAPVGRIDDFGEKLEGAKKDLWKNYQKAMGDELPADAKDITLSKHFPEPDYDNLIASGMDIKAIAAIKAMRDEIPSKPKMPSKVRRWVSELSALREFSNGLINGSKSIDDVLGILSASNVNNKFADRINLYGEIGYPAFKSAKGYNVTGGWTSFDKGVAEAGKKTALEYPNGKREYFNDRQTAVDALRKKLEVAPEGTERKTKLDVYRVTATGDLVIGKKVASNKYIDLKGGFKSPKEAFQYYSDNEAELLQLLEQRKNVRPERRSTNNPRVGIDYRLGQDVTPEKFAAEFGFRGVQFGNYVEQSRRPRDLNNAYDALLDLANIIGVPPRAISLNGTLGLAFGARGKGGKNPAAAHFERGEVVINLTKVNGFGSLGHEWFHAMDNYFSKARGDNEYLTQKPQQKRTYKAGEGFELDESIRPEVLSAFKNLMDAIRKSEYYTRSSKIDNTRTNDYWSTSEELAARAFEAYLIAKSKDAGRSNDYLANIEDEDVYEIANQAAKDFGAFEDPYPYPTRAEQTEINPLFDALFGELKTKETDSGNVAMFSRANQPTFYSALTRTIEEIKTNKADPRLWKGMIKNLAQKGVKPDEVEWTGVNEWLDLQTGSVTKEQVLEYLNANGVQVSETMLGKGDRRDMKSVRNPNDKFLFDVVDLDGNVIKSDLSESSADTFIENYWDGQGDTKYSKYTVEGGSNYKELLLTLPAQNQVSEAEKNEFEKLSRRFNNEADFPAKDLARYNELRAKLANADSAKQYKSSHFDQANILAHVRFDERTDADGNRVLFINEIQSDWGQEGKKKGFIDLKQLKGFSFKGEVGGVVESPLDESFIFEYKGRELPAGIDNKDKAINYLSSHQGETLSAPFVTKTDAWVSLALKRMMRYAAENGFDKVAFISGEQAADLYDLRKSIGYLNLNEPKKLAETQGYVGDPTTKKYILEGYKSAESLEPIIVKEFDDLSQLENIIGKETAKKIIDKTNETNYIGLVELRGDELAVGGEGMRTFYNSIVPKVTKDVLKKVGGQVESINMQTVSDEEFETALDKAADNGEMITVGSDAYNALRYKQQVGFTITPEMREKVMGGLPLFNREANLAKGLPKEAIQRAVNVLRRNWKNAPEIIVVQDMSDPAIREAVREENDRQLSQGAEGQPEGFFDAGKVYIVASEMNSPDDLIRVVFHETLGHYGLRGLYGKELGGILDRVAMLRKRDMAKKAKQYGLDLTKKSDVRIIAEEVLAEMAQTAPEASFVKRAIASIRNFLRDIGVKLELTDNDIIANYLLPARNFVVNGKESSSVAGLVSAFVRNNREPSKENGDTFLTAALEFTARNEELFENAPSDSKEIADIAKDMNTQFRVEPFGKSQTKLDGAEKAWEVFMPNYKYRSAVIYEKGDEVWINVARLQSGENKGNEIYSLAAAYAYNNDKVFIGDPLGLTDKAFYRRAENMLSSALKYGTTKHIEPHVAQTDPDLYYSFDEKTKDFGESVRKINWEKGDDAHNIKELIYTVYNGAITNIPELKNVIFNPTTQGFTTIDGEQFTDKDFARVVSDYYARTDGGSGSRGDDGNTRSLGDNEPKKSNPYRAGVRTAKRAALFNTFLREKSGERRREVLGSYVRELQNRGLSDSLKGTFYSRSTPQTETMPDTIIVDGIERPTLNSNGKPIHPTREGVENFWKWLGDSKVVDADGKPLVVYHGTNKKFDTFKVGSAQGWGKGIYFSDTKSSTEEFSGGDEGYTVESYLRILNPFKGQSAPSGAEETQAWNQAKRIEDEYGEVLQDGYADLDDAWQEDGVLVGNILRELGFDGVIAKGSNNIKGLEIVVFEPNQIKSAIGNNGDFDGNNNDIRFSRTASPQGRLTPQWQVDETSKMDNVVYALQDKNVDLKRVSQAIKKAGTDIADRWNAYLQEELYHGRTAKRTQDFIKNDLEPLIEDMRMRGVGMADFEEYLWARHAEERNIQIAKINPKMPDGGSGMSTQDARDYLANLSPSNKTKYEALARRIDLINRKSRQVLIDYGLESTATIASWESAYKNYVPLMREDMDTGFGNGTGQGFSVKGNSAKRATGSNRAVVDIIANMAQQYEKNVIRGEKNRVSTALIGLAKLNPNDSFWKVDTPPMLKTVSKSTGLVEERTDPNYKNRDNVIVARIVNKLGKVEERSVVFNQFDERAMRMAASLKNLDQDQIGELLGAASSITKYFASVNTQYNPIFGLINITRDVQGALLNLSTTPIANKKKEVLGNTLGALKGIYQDLRSERKNGTPSGNKWSQLFEEFQNEGGQTGYRDMFRNAKERGEALKNTLDPLWWQNSKIGKVISLNGTIANQEQWVFDKAIKPIFDWLSDYNNALENAVRLSVYKVALDNGHSKQQAASMAKNISVNFNRKGEMGRQIGSLYAFFNASVQGTARIGETLTSTDKNGKIKLSTIGKRIVQGGLLLGSMQALLLAAAGYDDDEPPEFVRDRSIIVPLDFFGADGKFVTVPMPLGYNAIPSFSRILTEWALSGGENTQERLVHILDMVMNVTNPIGNAGLSLQTIAPTVIDPLAALAENKDFTGRPIAREDFNSLNPTPGFTRAKDTASAISKGLAYGINAITGGTDYKPGEFSPSPDQIDYLIGQVTGGVGREAMKVEQTATALVTGEDLPAYKIPIVGRFYGDATGQSSQGNAFYKNLREINKHENQIKGMIKAGEDPTQYRLDNPESRLITQANYTERAVQKLRKQRRALLEIGGNPSAIESIDDRITELMLNLNEKVKLRKEMQ